MQIHTQRKYKLIKTNHKAAFSILFISKFYRVYTASLETIQLPNMFITE